MVLQAGRQVAHHQIRRQRRVEQKADLLRRPRCRLLLGVLTAAAGATVHLRRIVGAAARLLPAFRVRLQGLIELSDQRVFVIVGVGVDAKDGAAADAGGTLPAAGAPGGVGRLAVQQQVGVPLAGKAQATVQRYGVLYQGRLDLDRSEKVYK